jgi:hypothetical protein
MPSLGEDQGRVAPRRAVGAGARPGVGVKRKREDEPAAMVEASPAADVVPVAAPTEVASGE